VPKLQVALGADHAGYPLAVELRPWLPSLDVDVLDLGAHTFDAADEEINHGQHRGRNDATSRDSYPNGSPARATRRGTTGSRYRPNCCFRC